jgi:phosphatidate cytidylyltransferase
LDAWSEVAPRARPLGDSLVLRLLSGAVFVPVLIVVERLGGLAHLSLVLAIGWVGLVEFYRLLAARGERPYRALGLAAGSVIICSAYFQLGTHGNLLLTVVLIITMAIELLRSDNRGAVHAIGGTLFGVFYVAWLGSHLVFLRELPRLAGLDYKIGSELVLFLFLCAWGCDTGAYLIGKAIGRHPLLPRVSPRKSVEGAIGGLVFGALCGLAASFTFASIFSPGRGVALGLLISASGQIGDLVESLLKRDSLSKDSAAAMIIPGHGGVLDRFDSILFAAPVFYYVLRAQLL